MSSPLLSKTKILKQLHDLGWQGQSLSDKAHVHIFTKEITPLMCSLRLNVDQHNHHFPISDQLIDSILAISSELNINETDQDDHNALWYCYYPKHVALMVQHGIDIHHQRASTGLSFLNELLSNPPAIPFLDGVEIESFNIEELEKLKELKEFEFYQEEFEELEEYKTNLNTLIQAGAQIDNQIYLNLEDHWKKYLDILLSNKQKNDLNIKLTHVSPPIKTKTRL